MVNNEAELDARYSANHVAPQPLTLVSGDGAYVYDTEGNRYLDMVNGISVVNFGHSHPRLVQVLTEQASKLAICPRLFHNQPLTALLQNLCELTGLDKAIPMNSGAEAVETAIKVCRKWGYDVKNIAENCAEIIVCDNSFHGRTLTAVSLSTVDKYKQGFGPLTPGFTSIPFNDIDALQQAITPNTAAFIVEPIQGEAGVILPDDGYLKACQQVCQQNNVLFILDEIQSGMGRSGKFLAVQHDDITPDGVMLGKALGGGLLPISAFLAKEQVMQVLHPGEHGSTFGGNPLACHVANEALTLLQENNLMQQVQQLGHYFVEQLKALDVAAIKAVRGKGLFIAIELDTSMTDGARASQALLKQGVLCVNTRNKALRLLPALTITKQQIDDALAVIHQVLLDIAKVS